MRIHWRRTDVLSGLFLLTVAVNTALLAWMPRLELRLLLVLSQALLLAGCQEAKHQCVHGSFFSNRRANDVVGTFCAALFGVNFTAYRYFHLQHHRATCTDADPEGRLYELSLSTRWIWVLAPLEMGWVAFHINRRAWSMVPAARRGERFAALGGMLLLAALLSLCAWCAPQTLLWTYVLPLALFSWFDFVLTQAEHYGVAILPAKQRIDPGAVTHDIVLPLGLGWLNLHRTLHRVHHRYPALHWSEAPAKLRDDPTAPPPLSYATFVRRWLVGGPRLWPRAAEPTPSTPSFAGAAADGSALAMLHQ